MKIKPHRVEIRQHRERSLLSVPEKEPPRNAYVNAAVKGMKIYMETEIKNN